MNIDMIGTLVQAGGTGIAFYLIYTGRQERKDFYHILGNHMKHEIIANNKLTKALTELRDAILKK
jgi:hypothetical protein